MAAIFAAAGHDAHSIIQQSLGGQSDDRVIDVCSSEGRALVTLDLDFSNMQAYPPGNFAGIVVLRLTSQGNAHIESQAIGAAISKAGVLGGMLDRMDSVSFAAPVFFHIVRFFFT